MKVELVTHSGSDLLVVDAARASFSKKSEMVVVKTEVEVDEEGRSYAEYPEFGLSNRDVKLVNYLARERHMLPFRHPQVTLRCKAPLFVARQVGKHQTGMSWSEESRRYITTEPEFFWPDKWRKKAENVKQGSSDEEVKTYGHVWGFDYAEEDFRATDTIQDSAEYVLAHCVTTYNKMLEAGVAPELARMILPQNMYVTWVWTGSLLSFVHMIKERSADGAQKETRDFAVMVAEVIEPLYPVSYKALMEN